MNTIANEHIQFSHGVAAPPTHRVDASGETVPYDAVYTEGDSVNHPRHYNVHPSGIECIGIIRHMPYNLGAVFKYLWRAGLKNDAPPIQDLEKAAWYLADEIAMRKRQEAALTAPRKDDEFFDESPV